MSVSNYFENKLLDSLGNSSAAVAEVYVKLHTGDPGEEGTSNAAGETTRKKVTSWAAASGGTKKTSAALEWTNVSTSETYKYVSLWDASSAGNCLWSGALETEKAVSTGDTFKIASESLTVSID